MLRFDRKMVTISADVTPQMKEWVLLKIRKGEYKSCGDVVRAALRELIKGDKDYIEHWVRKQEESVENSQLEHLKSKMHR